MTYLNPHHGTPGLVVLPASGWRRAQTTFAGWPELGAVTLTESPSQAAALGVARVVRLDDTGLWGGGAAALGAAYGSLQAVLAALGRRDAALPDPAELGGASVTLASVADGPYGAGVRLAAAKWGAGWTDNPGDGVWISPIATPGYTEIPREIMQALRILGEAAQHQWTGPPPSHILAPGGDGAIAAALSVHLRPWGARLVIIEPTDAAPWLAHATGQAGPEPSLLAWQELERSAWAYTDDPAALGLEPDAHVLDVTGLHATGLHAIRGAE